MQEGVTQCLELVKQKLIIIQVAREVEDDGDDEEEQEEGPVNKVLV